MFPDTDGAKAFALRGRTDPFAGIPAHASLSRDDPVPRTVVISFHPVWWPADSEQGRTAGWVARRRERRFQAVTTTYADDRRCPALESALRLAEQIDRPEPVIPERSGLTSLPPDQSGLGDITLDTATYTLVVLGRFPSSRTRAEIQVPGDYRTPLGIWAHTVSAALEPCWSEQAPRTG